MKKFTKHILLLALMLFGAAGAAWATDRAPQKFTSAVNLSVLQTGDTLAEGASITYDIGNPSWDRIMRVERYRAKKNGTLVTDIYGEEINNIDFTIGAGGVIIDGSNSFTPVTQSGDDGNAWVVTFLNVEVEGELIAINISGIYIRDPYAPALDETTGNWNFLMPGSNKVVNVQLLDSIVLGPNVSYVTADPVIPPANRYTRGDSTILYYEPGSLASVTIAAAETDGNGKFFAYWADLATTDPQYTTPNRYVYSAEIVCGNRYVAAYPELYTLTLNANQGGTLTLDGYTPASVNGWTINVSNIGATGGDEMPIVSDFQITTVTLLASNNEVVGSGNLNAASGTIQIHTSGTATQVRFGFSWHNNDYNADYGDIITASVSAVSGQQLYEEGDLLAVTANFTCTPDVTPAVTPFGITANNNGTFNVMEGLTVNVTATPDSAHYLSAIGNEAVISNSAYNISFTMPDDDAELAATFTTKPTLTLAQTEGGTLEAIVPQGGVTAMHLTTDQIPTWSGNTEYAMEADLQQFGFVAVDSAAAAAWTGAPASGFITLVYALAGNQFKTIVFQDGQWFAATTFDFYKADFYTSPDVFYFTTGASKSNVIASSTPNTYYIDYGTPVTVKATPDAEHYLVSFSDDAPAPERNSNLAVEKTYDSVIAPINLTANFQAKPVLTLTANDGGTLTLDGMTNDTVYTIAFDHGGTDEGDRTFTIPASLMPYDTTFSYDDNVGTVGVNEPSGKLSIINRGDRTVTIRISGECTGIYSCDYGPGIFDQWLISCEASTQPKMPYGITKTGDNTYMVDYGTEVTVVANPDSIHYLATLGGVTMGSNTAKDTTFAVTATTNLAANFAQKPTLTLAHNDGGTLEAIVPQGGATAMHLTTDQIPTWPGNTEYAMEADLQPFGFVAVDSAAAAAWTGVPASGQVLLLYAPAGNSFKAIVFQDGQWYGAYTANFYKMEIYTNSDNYYFTTAATRPNVIASSTPNTYIIDYGTDVTVKATPDSIHYLATLGDNDTNFNFSVEKSYTNITADITSTAVFAPKPVLTFTVNDTAWGKVSPVDSESPVVEDFASFETGSKLAQSAINAGQDCWTTWLNNPGSDEDGIIANLNGNNCIQLGTSSDLVYLFGNKTSGTWEFAFDVYVPEGQTGYFNMLHNFAGYESTWAMQCYFNATNDGQNTTIAEGHGTLHAAGNGVADLPCAYDEWMHVRTVVDIDNNYAQIYLNNALMHTWQWDNDSFAENYGGPGLDAADFFTALGDGFYVDNFSFRHLVNNGLHPTDNDSTFIVDYGTEVNFVAMPSDTAYLVNFDGTDVRNDNDTATKVYTNITSNLTATATFTPKPVLTLAVNDTTWGNVSVELVMDTASSSGSGSGEPVDVTIGDGTSTTYVTPYQSLWKYSFVESLYTAEEIGTAGTITSISYNLKEDSQPQTNDFVIYMKNVSRSTFASTTDYEPVTDADIVYSGSVTFNPGWTTITLGTPFEYDGTSNLMIAFDENTDGYSTRYFYYTNNANKVVTYHADNYNPDPYNLGSFNGNSYLSPNRANIKLGITPAALGLPAGVAQLTDSTYRVDYGTELSLIAKATELHHVANWVDADSVAYPVDSISYFNYFTTQPDSLFPDSSTLTLTVTADTMAKAIFGLNYRNLVFSHNEGGHMEFVVNYDSIAFSGISTTSVTGGDITITADQADEDGMYLRNETGNINIAIEGGASITQVDFHITNGSNLVGTISTNAQGATITTTDNNEYGSIKGLNTPNLTISSSTTHDLQIDQFIVHYGNALPSGVAVGPNDSTWYVMPDTTVKVRAIPDEGHYLISWASAPDTIRILDTLTVEMTVTTDDTLKAVFAPNPVITLAVNDENAGSVYFTGYQGNTITRAGIIKAQSVDLPYQWYEAGEIMSIEGGNGMVTKDEATSHYLTVNGVFDGTATVVTSAGAFSITSYPTLPNGVRYNIADNNYTINPYTELSFTATPNPNYYFVDWAKVTLNDTLGVDSLLFSTEAVTTVRIDKDMKLQGNFLHNPYVLTLVADANMGTLDTVPGQQYVTRNDNGTYTVMTDSTVTLVAAANTGYHITGWQNAQGNQANLTNDTVRITIVSDSTVTVYFDTNSYNVTYTVQNDEREEIGTNQPMGVATLTGRDMHFLNDTLIVEANYGYTFTGWYVGNTFASAADTFVFSPVADVEYQARFTANRYAILGMPQDTLAGYVNGSDSVEYLDSTILQAFANTGYNFVEWRDTLGNELGTSASLTIQALRDSVVHAVFDTLHYNLVVNVDSASTGFGTATGSVAAARHFNEYQIVATADSGYHFVVWSDGDSNASRTVTLHSDSTFTAYFDTNTYNLNVVVAEACTGFGTVTGDTIAKHFLTYAISATANPGYHFVAWSDGDSNATRTVELVSDSTIEAIFEFNPSLTLVYRENNGDMKFVVESQTETFTGISSNELSAGAISVNATSADATYGMSLKNNTVTITASGDNVIKQVAFHLTNGVNRAETITATPADTLVVTNGNAYGTITGINSNSVTISSTSTKDINIDQLTIQYAPVLPAGVVHIDGDADTVYRLVPGTVVQVMAIPFEGNYLLSWDGDTTSTDDLIATVTMADSDLVVIANFSGDPVMTLTSNGEGRIYFENYSGYTINRDETILMTNYVFNGQNPYTWYEAGEIYEINDPTGMVTYDTATKHYISVHGQFTGTATVVTTSGSFAVTCIPTVPNGVTVMREGMYIIQPGTEVTVVAEPAEEHYLYSWDDITTTENVRDITVTSDTNIVVNFLHNPYTLTVTSDSVMGTVAPADGQAYVTANNDGTYTVMADSTVTLVATPSAGYHLTGWSNVDTTDLTIDVTMLSDSTVKAYFDTTHAELAWDTNAFTGYTMIDFNAYKPTLANPNGVEVRYGLVGADSNSAVVVSADSCIISNPMGGVITTAGTYTVYAVHDLTQEYFYDSVTYDLTVKNGAVIALLKNINNGGSIEFVNTEADLTHAYSVTDNVSMAFLAPGASFRAVATANEGYHLEGWQTGSNANGFEDFATGDTVLYTAPDTINARVYISGLRANFDTNHYVLVARAMDSCNGCGIVTGTDSAARHFVDYTVTAEATPCYHFVNWTDTLGNVLGTDLSMTLSPVSDSILVANFEYNTYVGDTTVDVCDQFTWHDSTYTVTPSVAPTFIYKTANNCDSLVTLNLTIRHSTNSDTTAVVCDVMNWYEHQNITGSCDTLTHDFVNFNAVGCDSTMTLHLTVKYSSNSLLDTTVCDEFTWTNHTTYYRSTIAHDTTLNAAGCDSIAYLDLKVNHPSSSEQTVVTCDSVYRWNGFVYTTSTIGIYHTENIYGCDSTATLNLTLNHAFTGYDVQEACVSHPWIDGNTYTTSQLDSTVTYTYAGGAANGCDSTVILLLTINQPVSTTESVTACDSYTWHGATYTASTASPSYTVTGSNGCDSTVTLDLTINNSVTSQFAAQTCSYYIWDGTYYDSTGTYTRTYSAANSCDSVVTMTLTVNSTITSSFDTTACGSYTWNGVEYAASGAYSHTYQSVYGCDSVVTMRLTLKQPVTTTLTATGCNSYEWNGQTYTESGNYSVTNPGANGCDSTTTLQLTILTTGTSTDNVTACDSVTWINGVTYYETPSVAPTYTVATENCSTLVTLNLTINKSVTSQFDMDACNSYVWDGTFYNQSGSYNKSYSGANSCDSTVTMNLTINQPTTATVSATSCDSYEWNGVTYIASGSYSYTMTGSNGCDSTTTLQLTINQSGTTSETVTACDEYLWNGELRTVSGEYRDTTTGTTGCTMVNILNLTIKNSTSSNFTATACNYYIWNGSYYDSTAVYSRTYRAANGCDSVVTLDLTVNRPVDTTINVSSCGSYTWNGVEYAASGAYTKSYRGANGCDSVVTINLTVKQPVTATESVTACDSYTWHGTTYTSSTSPTSRPSYTSTGSNDCDSITYLDLTINNSGTATETATACNEYEWRGTTYNVSGSYNDTTTGTNNCTLVTTLNLTIKNSTEATENVTACDSYNWHGTTYTSSTSTPSYTSTGSNGCDSTTYLNLTVNYGTSSQTDVTACDSYSWNGMNYTVSGTYTFDTVNSLGCDSTATLKLTVNYRTTATEIVTACDSYEWHGTTYTSSTSTPTYTSTGANGCDSTTTLQLTIATTGTSTDNITACDSLTWINGVTYYETPAEAPTFTVNGETCNTIVTLNLTINNSVETGFDTAACNYYIWDGNYYNNSGSYTKSYTAANGCDSVVTMALTVNHPVSSRISETVCGSYTWNSVDYTVSGVYTQVFTGSNGCDSTVTLALTVNQPRTTVLTATACDSYTWHGVTYTATGSYTFDTIGSNGCDSTATLQLTINRSTTATETATACDSYTWHGVTYTASGSYDYTTTGANGCAMVTTLNLTVNESATGAVDTTVCGNYIWAGTYYAASGVYNKTYAAANGCDSVVTLTLTVNQPVSSSFSESACQSYTWNNVEYAASGVYTQTFNGSNGCDSVVTLTLNIKQPVTVTVSQTACDSYTWNGQTYTASGSYSYTTTGSNGCDSTTVLQLTVNQTTTATETVTACDSYSWHGVTYTASTNTPTFTTTGANGCDLVTTLNLTVNSSVADNVSATACNYYIWDGSYYANSGVYVKSYTALNGCDSVVTMTLTVNQPVTATVSQTACDSYTWNGQTYYTSGNYSYTTTGSNGCDSTTTLHLTVNQSTTATETVSACGSYTWIDGVTYTASTNTPTFTTTGANGCNLVTTLHLSINNPVHTAETMAACESYTWNGTAYNASGDYTYSHNDANGCVQVDTLHLTINNPVHESESVVACGSYIWHGTSYVVTGDYTFSHADANGCTQVDTLHLTVGNSVVVNETVTTCDSYEWNGRVYTENGEYTYTTTTVNGCDSTVILHLTVNHSATSSFDTLAYGSFTWNGQTYTESGAYEQTLTTVNGCDSVVTLNLVILPEGFVMPYLYNLMDVMLSVNHNEDGAENVRYIWYRWYRNGELVLEGPNYDSYSENGNRLNGCYYLEVAVDESMQYWVRSNEVCINGVGIEDVENVEITLAPNPVRQGSMVKVSANGADLQGAELRVFDLQGRMVLEQKDNTVFMAPSATGMYMVRLTLSDGRKVVSKLIVK